MNDLPRTVSTYLDMLSERERKYKLEHIQVIVAHRITKGWENRVKYYMSLLEGKEIWEAHKIRIAKIKEEIARQWEKKKS